MNDYEEELPLWRDVLGALLMFLACFGLVSLSALIGLYASGIFHLLEMK